MSQGSDYEFEWDEAKAESNKRKHGVVFSEAMEVFLDPLALSLYDEGHSEDEERWISLGCARNGKLLVVVHTYASTSSSSAVIRIISARLATRSEREQYEQT